MLQAIQSKVEVIPLRLLSPTQHGDESKSPLAPLTGEERQATSILFLPLTQRIGYLQLLKTDR